MTPKEIKQKIKELENFQSYWNGEDTTFIFEGYVYTEDDVEEAEDQIQELQQQLKELE